MIGRPDSPAALGCWEHPFLSRLGRSITIVVTRVWIALMVLALMVTMLAPGVASARMLSRARLNSPNSK